MYYFKISIGYLYFLIYEDSSQINKHTYLHKQIRNISYKQTLTKIINTQTMLTKNIITI